MNIDLRSFNQCPACDAPLSKSRSLFKVLLLEVDCSVNQCLSCGLIYKELAPTNTGMAKLYSEEYVHFLNDSTDSDLASRNSARQKLARCRHLLGKDRSPDQIKFLDVGCGSGNFVAILRNLGCLAEGIDPYLPVTLCNPYLHRSTPEDIPPGSYDVAVLLNVVEHLTQPRAMFSAVLKLLKPDGVMLLTCPYGNSFARKIYRASWSHLALDEHLLFWTPHSLTYLLRELGFHGKISYRVAGSPFPYGHTKPLTDNPDSIKIKATELQSSVEPKNYQSKSKLQAQIWQLARTIQRHEQIANLMRFFIHLTHTGDYLEYAIRVGK